MSMHEFAAPRMATLLQNGGCARDWEELCDVGQQRRWDEMVLRDLESEARRIEWERAQPVEPISSIRRSRAARRFGGFITLARLFAATFQRDIGGVPGVSDSRFDADYYVVDGVSGKVRDFVDYVDISHTLQQLTSANQVAVPTADSSLSGTRTSSFTAHNYDSLRAAASYRFRHDGTGMEEFCLGVNTGASIGFWLCTRPIFAYNETGTGLAVGPSGVRFIVGNPTAVDPASSTIDTGYSAPAAGVGSPYKINVSYRESDSPEWRMRGNSTQYTGSSGTAPALVDPVGTLRLGGGSPSITAYMQARWRLAFVYRRVLSASARATVHSYIKATTGVEL